MTDAVAPPPSAPERRELDFAQAFSFVFRDPDWVRKTLIGGLVVLLSIFVIGIFILMGYMARLARNVAAGAATPLPEWDDIGGMLVEGLKLFVVVLAYAAPVIFVYLGIAITMIASSGDSDITQAAGLFSGCVLVIIIPIALALMLLLPVALTATAVTGSLAAAFDIPEILRFIRRNFINYILAIVIYMVANFVAQFGVILLCVGALFTSFLHSVISTWAFAETWRLDRRSS